MQYLRARYYSLRAANFLAEDSYLGDLADPLTLNRYNYVKSSPLNYTDPSGHLFLHNQGYNPNNWRKVVEKWASPDGTIYQRNYRTNGTDYYYHGEEIEEFFPH